MFKFTLTSVLLLIAIAMVDCSDSLDVHLKDTSDEYQLTERKLQMSKENSLFYMNVISKDDEMQFDYNFHNCARNKRLYGNYKKRYYIEDFYSETYIETFIVTSCCFLLLGFCFVYVLKSTQFAVHRIHILMTSIVFFKAFLFAVYTIKMYMHDHGYRGDDDFNWYSLLFLFYLAKGLSLCGCLMLVREGWIFFKTIFGRKERGFLMTVLSIQAISWIVIHLYFVIGHFEYDLFFLMIPLSELVSAIMVLIYFYIRKADTRSQKAAENLKKFQLFRFIYFMIALFFYFKGIVMYILTFHKSLQVILAFDDLCTLMFFAIIFYKCQPKKLSSIMALCNDEEALPITDISQRAGE